MEIQHSNQKQIGAIGRAEVVGKIDYREITLFVPKNSKVIDIIGTNTVSIPYVGG